MGDRGPGAKKIDLGETVAEDEQPLCTEDDFPAPSHLRGEVKAIWNQCS